MPRDGRDSINMLRRPAVAVRRFALTGRHWQSGEMHRWESNGQSGGMSGAAEGLFALSDRKVSLWYTLFRQKEKRNSKGRVVGKFLVMADPVTIRWRQVRLAYGIGSGRGRALAVIRADLEGSLSSS